MNRQKDRDPASSGAVRVSSPRFALRVRASALVQPEIEAAEVTEMSPMGEDTNQKRQVQPSSRAAAKSQSHVR